MVNSLSAESKEITVLRLLSCRQQIRTTVRLISDDLKAPEKPQMFGVDSSSMGELRHFPLLPPTHMHVQAAHKASDREISFCRSVQPNDVGK